MLEVTIKVTEHMFSRITDLHQILPQVIIGATMGIQILTQVKEEIEDLVVQVF